MELRDEVEVMASLRDKGELRDEGTLPAPGDSIPESSMLDSLLLLFSTDSSTNRPYVHGDGPWLAEELQLTSTTKNKCNSLVVRHYGRYKCLPSTGDARALFG